MNKPKCATKGMVIPGAMCGSVIVGGVYCGHSGECEHKIEPDDPTEMPGDKARWAATCEMMLEPSNAIGQGSAACGASPAPTGCASGRRGD